MCRGHNNYIPKALLTTVYIDIFLLLLLLLLLLSFTVQKGKVVQVWEVKTLTGDLHWRSARRLTASLLMYNIQNISNNITKYRKRNVWYYSTDTVNLFDTGRSEHYSKDKHNEWARVFRIKKGDIRNDSIDIVYTGPDSTSTLHH